MVAVRYNVVHLEDVVASMPATFGFTQSSEGAHLPRYAPSLVAGPGTHDFLNIYYRPTGAFSRQGIFSIKDASVIADGVIVHGDSMLMSPALMMILEA